MRRVVHERDDIITVVHSTCHYAIGADVARRTHDRERDPERRSVRFIAVRGHIRNRVSGAVAVFVDRIQPQRALIVCRAFIRSFEVVQRDRNLTAIDRERTVRNEYFVVGQRNLGKRKRIGARAEFISVLCQNHRTAVQNGIGCRFSVEFVFIRLRIKLIGIFQRVFACGQIVAVRHGEVIDLQFERRLFNHDDDVRTARRIVCISHCSVDHIRTGIRRQTGGGMSNRVVDIEILRISNVRKRKFSGRRELTDRAVRLGIARCISLQTDCPSVIDKRLRRAVPRRVDEQRVDGVHAEIFTAFDIIGMVVFGIIFAVEEIDNIVDCRRAFCLRIDVICADGLQPFVCGGKIFKVQSRRDKRNHVFKLNAVGQRAAHKQCRRTRNIIRSVINGFGIDLDRDRARRNGERSICRFNRVVCKRFEITAVFAGNAQRDRIAVFPNIAVISIARFIIAVVIHFEIVAEHALFRVARGSIQTRYDVVELRRVAVRYIRIRSLEGERCFADLKEICFACRLVVARVRSGNDEFINGAFHSVRVKLQQRSKVGARCKRFGCVALVERICDRAAEVRLGNGEQRNVIFAVLPCVCFADVFRAVCHGVVYVEVGLDRVFALCNDNGKRIVDFYLAVARNVDIIRNGVSIRIGFSCRRRPVFLGRRVGGIVNGVTAFRHGIRPIDLCNRNRLDEVERAARIFKIFFRGYVEPCRIKCNGIFAVRVACDFKMIVILNRRRDRVFANLRRAVCADECVGRKR